MKFLLGVAKMTKERFLEGLNYELRRLPEEDRVDAIEYYREYIEESPGSGEDAIKKLGSPVKVSSKILAEYRMASLENNNDNKLPKKGFAAVGAVILAILAAPIGLPLAIAFVAVILAIAISVFAVLFSIMLAGAASVAFGIFGLIMFIPLMIKDIATGIGFLGTALVCLGVGAVFLIAIYYGSKYTVKGFVWLARRILRRDNNGVA